MQATTNNNFDPQQAVKEEMGKFKIDRNVILLSHQGVDLPSIVITCKKHGEITLPLLKAAIEAYYKNLGEIADVEFIPIVGHYTDIAITVYGRRNIFTWTFIGNCIIL